VSRQNRSVDRQASRNLEHKHLGHLERFAKYMKEFDDVHVRRVVAGNPNTPEQVLGRLAEDSISIIRRHVAENPRTPSEILRRLAADTDLDVRLAVAENSNTPQDTLSLLAIDNNVDVRYGVAENPHMPEKILVALTKDDNPYVRCRALKTLQMLSPESQSRLNIIWQSSREEDSHRNQVG
jgi:hypothetical protein